MFAAIDDALARLYPRRRWGLHDADGVATGHGGAASLFPAIVAAMPDRVKAPVFVRTPEPHEWCDSVDVLCLGRTPCLAQLCEGAVSAWSVWESSAAAPSTPAALPIEEVYLRVSLSTLAPFAVVQEVRMTLTLRDGLFEMVERPRAGVFDPILLDRYRRIVTLLTEQGVRNIDFGDITGPPAGFAPGDYSARYGSAPTIANYLFFPYPVSTENTTYWPTARKQEIAGDAWEIHGL